MEKDSIKAGKINLLYYSIKGKKYQFYQLLNTSLILLLYP